MKKNILEKFFDKVLNVPLWIKQVIYKKLANEMKSYNCDEFLIKNQDNIFSTCVPLLTFKGKEELENKKCGLDNNIYNFLQCCADGSSIGEICVNSFLTMEETAKYFVFCVEQNFIKKPESEEICKMAEFISGKILTDEYFKEPINKSLLILKNEAKKRLIIDYNSLPAVKTEYSSDKQKYEDEINRLKQENTQLKQKMNKLLDLVKKDAEL